MAFVTQPLPAELLHLLVEGEWVLAPPPRADAGNDPSEPLRHRFEAEGVDVWLARDTGVSTEPLEAVARNLERREATVERSNVCLLYTSPSPRDGLLSRMPSSA